MSLRDYLFHEEPGITLYCGDCRDVLSLLEAEAAECPFVDLVLTDPPYGDTSLTWDVRVADWLTLAGTLLLRSGSLWCFGSLRFFMRGGFEGWTLAQDVIWEKHNGAGFAADRFKRVHEHAVQFYPVASTWAAIYKAPQRVQRQGPSKRIRKRGPTPHTGKIGQGAYEDDGTRLQRSVIHVQSEHARAEHPTQKPLGIIRPLVGYSCPEEGAILDPFAGSGTTLVAAREMQRRAIGIEIEPHYCEIAVKRLRQGVLALDTTPAPE